jgi:hypothetical protein
MEQMKDVWGFHLRLLITLISILKFCVSNIRKIDINNASIKEIAQFPYFKYAAKKKLLPIEA